MVKTLREWEKALSQAVDTDYSYGLARRMEGYKSNAALGYRTAGSRAEWETGEMILREMQALGLSDVHKDRIEVDGWEFKKAVMSFSWGRTRQTSIPMALNGFPWFIWATGRRSPTGMRMLRGSWSWLI